jgi:hypothetical protein
VRLVTLGTEGARNGTHLARDISTAMLLEELHRVGTRAGDKSDPDHGHHSIA